MKPSDQREACDTPAESRPRKRAEVRPLTTDERASFAILALYLATFCLATFLYWDSLLLRIAGATAAVVGAFLFWAAFFNRAARGRDTSRHPLRSYLVSFFFVLLTLFLLRLAGGLIRNVVASVAVLYAGLFAALVVFRKAMVQVVSVLLVLAFLFVTFHNWDEVVARRMGFRDAVRQCGLAIFRLGPIQDVTNMLVAGNYIAYLRHIDYRNEQINNLATRLVARSEDDELLKTRAILRFVAREIHYVSDPDDGIEYAKEPINTLISGGGDCEDQTLLVCALLESVGVRTYIAFTESHVFALVRFRQRYQGLPEPHVYIDGIPCYAIDATLPEGEVGLAAERPGRIDRIFEVRSRSMVHFSLSAPGN